jgi:hypothetical protein
MLKPLFAMADRPDYMRCKRKVSVLDRLRCPEVKVGFINLVELGSGPATKILKYFEKRIV